MRAGPCEKLVKKMVCLLMRNFTMLNYWYWLVSYLKSTVSQPLGGLTLHFMRFA